MLKYFIYLLLIGIDIGCYCVLWKINGELFQTATFTGQKTDIYLLISEINTPFFVLCALFSFNALRKTDYTRACYIAAFPILLTLFYFIVYL